MCVPLHVRQSTAKRRGRPPKKGRLALTTQQLYTRNLRQKEKEKEKKEADDEEAAAVAAASATYYQIKQSRLPLSPSGPPTAAREREDLVYFSCFWSPEIAFLGLKRRF